MFSVNLKKIHLKEYDFSCVSINLSLGFSTNISVHLKIVCIIVKSV